MFSYFSHKQLSCLLVFSGHWDLSEKPKPNSKKTKSHFSGVSMDDFLKKSVMCVRGQDRILPPEFYFPF